MRRRCNGLRARKSSDILTSWTSQSQSGFGSKCPCRNDAAGRQQQECSLGFLGGSHLRIGDCVTYNPTGPSDGFLYDSSTGAFTDVTPPESISTIIQGINTAGQIAGSARNSPSQPVYGFIYQDGNFSIFEILDGRRPMAKL